ncbi:MAG TPA: beta-galactosidase [Polyangiaceae bacterium]|nr:beta-galactosidase [Polyangiaceae bacterium]
MNEPRSEPETARVRLVPGGLELAGEVLPLHAGSVHYWHMDPSTWRPALESLKSMGLGLVDTYVPWGVHETAPGEFDFGEREARLGLGEFLRIAHEIGLRAIVRPGPHINAELTFFGIPARVIWDERCQARSARAKPVILPVPPLAFPVPSYASEAFQTEAAQWLRACADVLEPHVWPNGPVVLYQIDNEGALYFRDGVYDQDYHPDALSAYRRFLQAKYATLQELRRVYADGSVTFAGIEPPKQLNVTAALELAPHLDWADFQEQLLADAFARMRAVLAPTALGKLPCSHNLPLSEGATPLDPARVTQAVDFVGLDYYHGASPNQRAEVARRTSELAVRCELDRKPVFACELGAGFPPFFPPLRAEDNAFTALVALAYGLRGFNVYMAVERDRWIGAPIDRTGQRRNTSEFWEKLVKALERTRFHELRRATPVQILVPRSFRRLARVLHAFGPFSAALFQVMGGSAEEACFEDELGFETSIVIEAQRFMRALEAALEARRIPYGIASGDLAEAVLERAQWSIVACTGALEPEIVQSVARAIERGKNVTVGPFAPERDPLLWPLEHPLSLLRRPGAELPSLLALDESAITTAMDQASALLGEYRLEAAPKEVFLTCHSDSSGGARVLFVINPSEQDLVAEVTACGAASALDGLEGHRFTARAGRFRLAIRAHSVRLLELARDS